MLVWLIIGIVLLGSGTGKDPKRQEALYYFPMKIWNNKPVIEATLNGKKAYFLVDTYSLKILPRPA